MRRLLAVTVTALMTTIGLGTLAGAAGADGAQKVPLGHPFYIIPFAPHCSVGPAQPSGTNSFAIFHQNGAGTVSAEVALKHATPNATYTAMLGEGPLGAPPVDPCFTYSPTAALTTNGQGNGNVHLVISAPGQPSVVFVELSGPDGLWGAFVVIPTSDGAG